jgi:hypothetical protein
MLGRSVTLRDHLANHQLEIHNFFDNNIDMHGLFHLLHNTEDFKIPKYGHEYLVHADKHILHPRKD